MTRPHGGLQVLRHCRFLQVEGRFAVGFFSLADSQCRPGAALHKFAFGGHSDVLACRTFHVVVALGGLERKVTKVAMACVRVTVSHMISVVAAHDAGSPIGAVAVQVVVRTPPACYPWALLGVWLAFLALTPFAVFVVPMMVSVMVVVVVSAVWARVSLGAVHLGWPLEWVGFGEELLDGVHQVADAPRTLVALLVACGGCRRALVLQRVKTISVNR